MRTLPVKAIPFCPPTLASVSASYSDASRLRDSPRTDHIARRIHKLHEFDSQASLVSWWSLSHKSLGVPDERLLIHIPTGPHQGVFAASRLKRLGLRKGIPDLLLALPRHGYAALWLVFKSPCGSLTSEQRSMHVALRSSGHEVTVSRSTSHAIACIRSYLAAPQ